MKTLITSIALAMLFALSANADVIHATDYEADGASQGTGLAIQPASMGFTDGGGDFVGQPGLGISDTAANSGSYSYVVDTSMTVDNGNGWGGNWSGMNSDGATSGGFTTEADAIAAGAGCYIDYSEGAEFTVSVWAATDAAGVTGGATLAPRLEFKSGGTEQFRNDAGATNASTLTETWQEFTWTYTMTAADEGMGIDQVAAVIGTDGLGFGSSTGNVYFDDFSFEVNPENVVIVGSGHAAVPEPSTASLLLAGLMGLCGIRRRKS